MKNETVVKKVSSALFTLENNRQNRAFLDMFKANLNTEFYSVRVRGRHSDRKAVFKKHKITSNYTVDMPVKYAERLAVYVNIKQKHKINRVRITIKCKYCGRPNGSTDPNLLCSSCRETFGHARDGQVGL